MARLAEYLADLSTLLGQKEHVHFVEIKESSAAVVHAVDHEAIPKVRSQVHSARTGNAEADVIKACDKIQRRLRSDNARAVLRPVGNEGARLLYFPGAAAEAESTYGPFREQGQLRGVPISIGGKRKVVGIHLQDGESVHICEASRDLALQLAPLMFNHHVRVYGAGRYFRDSDGNWEMMSFRISHFDELDSRPLAETVERLRSITRKVGLDLDVIKQLTDFRTEP